MSKVDEVMRKLERYIMDDSMPADKVGTGIVQDILIDDDFDALASEYPELGLMVDRGSDMEYESEKYAEQGRQEVRKLFVDLKQKLRSRKVD